MANTRWRLSGGIGVPLDEDNTRQKMTQGLGFPLRPVDNVPSSNFEDIYEGIEVAEGLFMQLIPDGFVQGKLYPAGSVVRDGGFLMGALVPTFDKAGPVPTDEPTWGLPDVPGFSTQNNLSVVYSGHEYTFTESGIVEGLRVWVPELTGTTNYRIVIVDITDPNDLSAVDIPEPILDVNAWTQIAYSEKLVGAGTKWLVFIDALNSGGDSLVTGGWTYNGTSGLTPIPSTGGWARNNTNEEIRISKTDLDSTDRSTELSGMIPGTTVAFVQTTDTNKSYTYRIDGEPTDNGTDFTFPVVLLSLGPLGGVEVGAVSTMTATVPIPQATQYSEVAGNPAPSWATVLPYLAYNGIDQGAANVSFGVDLQFEPATISEDWYIMAITQV
jgi:hypothetical protein